MSEKGNLQENVKEQFRQYLIANGLRQTKERFAILNAIYETEGVFTIEDLQHIMQVYRFHVSTNTLYLTTQLLVQANLLIRHPFSSSAATFERIADDRPQLSNLQPLPPHHPHQEQGTGSQPRDLPPPQLRRQPPNRLRLWHLHKLPTTNAKTAQARREPAEIITSPFPHSDILVLSQ